MRGDPMKPALKQIDLAVAEAIRVALTYPDLSQLARLMFYLAKMQAEIAVRVSPSDEGVASAQNVLFTAFEEYANRARERAAS